MSNYLTLGKKAGKSLFEAAQQANQKRINDACIGYVQSQMQLTETLHSRIQRDTEIVELIQRRLGAIENGEVKIDRQPNGGVAIVFDDETLNENQVNKFA